MLSPGRKAMIVIAISLAGGLVLGFAASSSANYWVQCGSQTQLGAGWYHVRAHKLSCQKARAVARRYAHSFDTSPYGFECGSRSVGEELSAIRCGRTQGGIKQKVAFQVGA